MQRLGSRLCVALLGTATVFASADLARADGDDEVLRELRALRERVQELEQWKADREQQDAARDASTDAQLAHVIEGYLERRGDAPLMGNVRAPRSRSIEFGGMIRVRGEMQRRTPTSPDVLGRRTGEFVLGRARLHADADISEHLAARIEIQDARVWGSEPSTAADTGGVDLSEGWVRFDRLGDGPTSLKLGRQKFALSDQRFIGHLEWSNSGRRFDGASLVHAPEGAEYTAFAFRTADGFPAGDPSDGDQDLLGVWATWKDAPACDSTFEAFAILVNDGRSIASEVAPGTGRSQFWNIGSRLHGKDADSGFDWDFQGAIQTGELGGDDLSAWALRGGVGMAVGEGRLGVEYNHATGDDDPTNGDRDQFQVLFPTNHGYYGIHDLASWSNIHAWSINYARPLSNDLSLKAAFWRFKLDERAGGWISASGRPVRAGAAGSGRSLGHELDLILTWKQSERVTWQIGWAHFFAGEFARDTEPDGHDTGSDFLYLQTVVTF